VNKWIGFFVNFGPGDNRQAVEAYLVSAKGVMAAALQAGVGVKILTPAQGDPGPAQELLQWLEARGIKGCTLTDRVDAECALLIGAEVFRVEPDNSRLCPPCQSELAERLAQLGIRSWPPRGGGIMELM